MQLQGLACTRLLIGPPVRRKVLIGPPVRGDILIGPPLCKSVCTSQSLVGPGSLEAYRLSGEESLP